MKKVLIITYYWPPASSPGVQRWLKFVKYLSEFDIEPIVLTVDNASVPAVDETLLEDVPAGLKVVFSKALEPISLYNALVGKKGNTAEVGLGDIKETKSPIKKLAKYLRSNVFIPDAKIGWYYNVRKKAVDLVNSEQIDTIITTGPPHTTHLIGNYVKQKTGVKWIVDFRDPWTGIFYEKYLSRSERSKQKNKSLEQMVLANSDEIITVSNGLKQEFPSADEKITVIANGFDPADLPKYEPTKTKYFTLVYTGNLKANQNINGLWKAIESLCTNTDFRNYFRLELVGNVHAEIRETINKHGLTNIVEYKPFVQHKEAVKIMMYANMLWLPIPMSANNKLIITGKIFEYLAARTPILSIGPSDGDAAKILAACERDPIIDYDEVATIEKQIMTYFSQWKSNNGFSTKHEGDAHMVYARRSLTQRLANQIHQLN